jgi:hypothetical protein
MDARQEGLRRTVELDVKLPSVAEISTKQVVSHQFLSIPWSVSEARKTR